jgi:predicted negative regulator of RcsB-dependent stress response
MRQAGGVIAMTDKQHARHFKEEEPKRRRRERKPKEAKRAARPAEDKEAAAFPEEEPEDEDGFTQIADVVDSAAGDAWDDPFDLMPEMQEDAEPVQTKAEPEPEPKKHHPIRNLIVFLLVLLIAAAGVFGYEFHESAQSVASSARAAAATGSDFMSSLQSGSTASLSGNAESLARYAASMEQETESPVWKIAEHLPVIGDDATRVATLADVVQDLTDNVVKPVAKSLSAVSGEQPFADHAINASVLKTYCDALAEAEPSLASAQETVDSLGTADFAEVAEPLAAIQEKLDTLGAVAGRAKELSPVLSGMLGAEGERTYLFVVEDTSDIRSVGGAATACAVMTIDNGTIRLQSFEDLADELVQDDALTDDEQTLLGLMGHDGSFTADDAGSLPSFSRAAQLLIKAAEGTAKTEIDGVIAVDPVFLQSMLGLTSGVMASDGTKIDGTNLAALLLAPDEEVSANTTFAQTASLAVNAVLSNMDEMSYGSLAKVLNAGMDEGRLLFYMADEDEEAALDAIGAAGAFAEDASTTETGFFLSDVSNTGLGSSVSIEGTVGDAVVAADGSISYDVTVKLANSAEDTEDEHPLSASGKNAKESSTFMGFAITAPAGATISKLSCDATSESDDELSLYGTDVWAGTFSLGPQESASFTYTVTLPAGADAALTLRMTPQPMAD